MVNFLIKFCDFFVILVFNIPVYQRNWVFATNSAFLNPISLDSNVVNLRYFKLWILFEISKICDIGFQRYRDYKFRVCGKDSIPFCFFGVESIKKQMCGHDMIIPSIRTKRSMNLECKNKLVTKPSNLLKNRFSRLCFWSKIWRFLEILAWHS